MIHEDAIKVGGATKAPDYCFRIGGTRKFFVEAKKPAVNIKDDRPGLPTPPLRLVRQAAAVSILTDFEEFAVYDCRMKPGTRTTGLGGARALLTYHEYPEHWDEIASIFSKEAVSRARSTDTPSRPRRKKGTAEVDDAFLSEIEAWRDVLARNIALRNPASRSAS